MRIDLLRRFSVLCVLGLSCGLGFGRTVSLDQVPAPVKRTAETELKNGPIKQVQSLEHNGRTIYEVTYQTSGGAAKQIYLESDGRYVNDKNFKPETLTREVQINQVPEAVRRTISTETSNGPVARIQQLPNSGKPMYEVFFNQPNGKEKIIYLNPDGTYVTDSSAGRGTTGASSSTTSSGQGTSGNWRSVAPVSRQPLSGASKVTFNQLPKPVQHAFENEAGTAPIESIDRGSLNGKTVYEAAFKRSGQTVKLRVSPDGAVVQDAQDSRILSGAPIVNGRAIGLSQVPAAVQNSIQAEAGTGRVESVQQGQMNGQTVYEATVNRNGQTQRIRLNAAGTVLSVAH